MGSKEPGLLVCLWTPDLPTLCMSFILKAEIIIVAVSQRIRKGQLVDVMLSPGLGAWKEPQQLLAAAVRIKGVKRHRHILRKLLIPSSHLPSKQAPHMETALDTRAGWRASGCISFLGVHRALCAGPMVRD